jgi:anti-anti-sigma factor
LYGWRIISPVELLKIVPIEVRGTLRLVGELDVSNVERVQARLEQELASAGALTLDTSEVSIMDSQGIRMLIALGEKATAMSSVIVLLNCSKAVRRSLDVAVPQGIPSVDVINPDTQIRGTPSPDVAIPVRNFDRPGGGCAS